MTAHWERRKLFAGLIFAVVGISGVFLSMDFDVGTVTNVGPGGFPLLLSAILAILGFANIASSGFTLRGEGLGAWNGRAFVLIPLSALVFGAVIDRLGLVPAVLVASLICTLANPRIRLVEVVVICVVLAVFSAGIFVYGLGLPFPLFAQRW